MSDPADSAGEPGEATGALDSQLLSADSTPTPESPGQEQGDQSSSEKRINGLMSLANRRLEERNAALLEIEELKAQLAEREAVEEQHDPSQVEVMFPERFAQQEEATDADGETIDPMAPPEPPTIHVGVNPPRGRSAPFGAVPGSVDTSSPSARYLADQAEIGALKGQLNRLGQQWVSEARERGLMPD